MAKTKKKPARPTGVFADRCAPIKRHIRQVEVQIEVKKDALKDEDIPQKEKDQIKKQIAKLEKFLKLLKLSLRACLTSAGSASGSSS